MRGSRGYTLAMLQRADMPTPRPRDDDERVVLHGVSWEQYEAIRAATDHIAGLHLTYLEGELEIMSPSSRHEVVKTLLARLLEAWAEERKVPLNGYGSTTYRKEARKRGIEPDECYILGPEKAVPDLAIEVVITGAGVDKLAVYHGLGVPEVWFWVDGRISIFQREGDGYVEVPRSRFLPDLDPTLLAGVIAETRDHEQTEAVAAFRARLRDRS